MTEGGTIDYYRLSTLPRCYQSCRYRVAQRVSGLHLGRRSDATARFSPASLAATMDRETPKHEFRQGDYPPEDSSDEEFATLPSLAAIKDSLAIAERLAQASLMTSPAAKRRLQARRVEMGLGEDPGYVPPKHLLLYLVRMGSFNSAPKIMNEDTEDADFDLPPSLTQEQLLDHCRQRVSPPPLLARRFRHLTDPSDAESPSKSIRILQWNLLSQSLGQNNDNFVSCPDEALEWNRRRHLIAEEIVKYSPDVVCLQEVDHFKFLQKVLGSQGFRGTFMAKPDSPCLYIKGNNGPDGCAIFYRSDRFQLLHSETRVLEVWRVQSNQVAVLVILKDRITSQEVCVATTHLKARNGALLSALRNEQGKDLLEWIAQHAGGRPLVLSGDFNAEPTEPIYNTVLGHDLLRLTSAYASAGTEPPYTTWKIRDEGEVCHTIDYMFCSKDSLCPVSLLEFPTGEEIGPDRIPSLSYPSDHFSLVCDFKLKSS